MGKQVKYFDVTNMTPKQRRDLFIECISQTGFTVFIKNQTDKQTHFIFKYEK
ncbi:MAG: hypothetical protein LBI79_05320 [Nitrososphaerota archaeon]|nr:hypothetical protein [Nitrososphaerota archaeon]